MMHNLIGLNKEVSGGFMKPTSVLGLQAVQAPWCLKSSIEVAGPPSATLH